MEFISIPTITLVCYLIGEIYKVVFKTKEDLYKLIPVLLTITGGLIGIGVYYLDVSYLEVTSVVSALEIGLVSGAASTGLHQSIKQMIKTNKIKEN